MPFRDVEDFAPVTLIPGGPLMLAVNAQLPVRSFAELIALAKAKPGELNYGAGARSIVGGISTTEYSAYWRAGWARTGQMLAEAGIAPE